MNISGYIKESIVDGQGLRAVVFFSGCYHNCFGCHSPQTHDKNYGEEFTESKQQEIIEDIKSNPLLSGLTLSGGDCFFSAKEVIKFVIKLKNEIPDINIWVYTGFTIEQLMGKKDNKYKLLEMCDVLVDGKFEIGLRDTTIKFAGSRNQRILDVKESLECGKAILLSLDK
ncbi:anaerobic ribonucleoside-triphosphate reductase activating protein [Paenibacillus donghaensis]|uniref:Anaerobic ribonucleoside-triphosphate reductase-activating protein n=1 Tax=Paenibacillus donghaensis TaxID=414771 RepID=A0A2Z2KQH8_9BACL|nr:anaerobic ribonucleoside-triphosphate reductase activating protein [Paenibacillus donghaensis]ASA22581.1 anaerobic ribonucleoside-triphosphate reductase activating protein [Paenibacillus donghaensis]